MLAVGGLAAAWVVVVGAGCRSPGSSVPATAETAARPAAAIVAEQAVAAPSPILQTAYASAGDEAGAVRRAVAVVEPEPIAVPPVLVAERLADLETAALMNNPTLRRMRHEATAERARAGYVAKLPDPSVGATVFTPPMHFEPDRQRAELQVMQMLPWLSRLHAEARAAYLEAAAAENEYEAERLRVLGEVRAAWFRLYVLGKQIEITEADRAQLNSLVETANARVAAGDAQPGDVLMATLELSGLDEQLISYRQQVVSTGAEVNRLVGRDAALPVAPPPSVALETPDWSYEFLRHLAHEAQPELNAARLRTAATRWGIESARLKRRPDVTLGAGWMVMDAPGAVMPDAGSDSFTLGVTTTLPIAHRKYDAMTAEASHRHYAAHASEEETTLRLDALLRDLSEQAAAGRRTLELYETSILPQARQTFAADQKSLANNSVTFDRVIRDYRTLLGLELGYHRALGQYATTLARIRQAVGVDLRAMPHPAGR
jgi:outer membrane protein TolC